MQRRTDVLTSCSFSLDLSNSNFSFRMCAIAEGSIHQAGAKGLGTGLMISVPVPAIARHGYGAGSCCSTGRGRAGNIVRILAGSSRGTAVTTRTFITCTSVGLASLPCHRHRYHGHRCHQRMKPLHSWLPLTDPGPHMRSSAVSATATAAATAPVSPAALAPDCGWLEMLFTRPVTMST